MTRNPRIQFMVGVLAAVLSIGTVGSPQMAPKTMSIVRNDSTSAVTIECHSGDEWKQAPIDPQKDIQLNGDRIRVATTRPDKAIITIDLPIEGGKKYRLFWNDKTGMWDFSIAS